jgi:hypothetical protein
MTTQNSVKAEIDKILTQSGNDVCAECGYPRPRWASISIGVFVCSNYAGAHRTLGTQASVIKSLDHDIWKPEWLHALERLGNLKAKDAFEHNVPCHFKRPLPAAAGSLKGNDALRLEKWVRAKYVLRLFAAPADLKLPGYAWDSNIFLAAWVRHLG